MNAFGDSIVKGEGYPYPFPAIIAKAKNTPVVNFGINGAQAADVADAVYSNPVTPTTTSILAVGVNDMRTNGGNTTKQSYFGKIYAALSAYLAIPDEAKVTATGSAGVAATSSGTWSSGVWPIGKYTNQNGAKMSFSLTGSTIYVGMLMSDTWTGTFNIKVDGVVKYQGQSNASGNVATVLGRVWAPQLCIITGLTNTAHSVEVMNTSASGGNNYIGFDWAAVPTVGPKVYIGSIGKMNAQGYGTYGGSDAMVDQFNAILSYQSSQFFNAGLNVYPVPSSLNPNVDLADGLHPVHFGKQKQAIDYLNVMNAYGI
jgi:hypothetical protein